MKRKYGVAVLLCTLGLAAGIVGCFASGSPFEAGRLEAGKPGSGKDAVTMIQLTDREKAIASLSGDVIAAMEIRFPADTGSRELYLEEWINGEKASSELLIQGDGEEHGVYYISSDIENHEDGTWAGTRWKIMSENEGVRTVTGDLHTVFPEGKRAKIGSSGIYGENEAENRKQDEYVLAARCFQFDKDFIETVSCSDMAEDDHVFEKYDYVVLVRLVVGGSSLVE